MGLFAFVTKAKIEELEGRCVQFKEMYINELDTDVKIGEDLENLRSGPDDSSVNEYSSLLDAF